MNNESLTEYDAIIIGAGMSGLAAGIRLAMFSKKVCILEKHRIPGGLNSYYKRGKRQFDVGLHAMTNYVKKGSKGTPLTKLLRQLRIPYDSLHLNPQKQSKILFPENELLFNNNIELLKSEIHQKFPSEIDNFVTLLALVNTHDETSLTSEYMSAKMVVKNIIKSKELTEMIFCPLMIYGSAWEHDMDFSQFVIMFKSIFLEGFSRPDDGVRTIIDLLVNKFESLGGEIKFNQEVSEIETHQDSLVGLKTTKGLHYKTNKVFSSMGLPETQSVLDENQSKTNFNNEQIIGKMSFTETILMTKERPVDFGESSTIIFYNAQENYNYSCPNTFIDNKSAVICFPNNFEKDTLDEGVMRLTFMANYSKFAQLSKEDYKKQKEVVYDESISLLKNQFNINPTVNFSDVFTPTTVKRYTGHFNGTVYGSTQKTRDGSTSIKGLTIIGTDQGFLGIIGAMLSGISMANFHGLVNEN